MHSVFQQLLFSQNVFPEIPLSLLLFSSHLSTCLLVQSHLLTNKHLTFFFPLSSIFTLLSWLYNLLPVLLQWLPNGFSYIYLLLAPHTLCSHHSSQKELLKTCQVVMNAPLLKSSLNPLITQNKPSNSYMFYKFSCHLSSPFPSTNNLSDLLAHFSCHGPLCPDHNCLLLCF